MISTEVFMDIFSLRNQGLSIRAIAKKTWYSSRDSNKAP